MHKSSVGKACLPNWYLLLCLDRWNTAQHFSKLRSTRSKCYRTYSAYQDPLSSPFFHSFNDFHVNKGSAGEAHPTHWYHLFRFGPKDRSHTNEFKIIPLFVLVRLPFFLPFFAILTIFTTTMPLYARQIYVIGIYNFVLVHRIQLAIYLRPDQRVQNAIRHYLACQDLCF